MKFYKVAKLFSKMIMTRIKDFSKKTQIYTDTKQSSLTFTLVYHLCMWINCIYCHIFKRKNLYESNFRKGNYR